MTKLAAICIVLGWSIHGYAQPGPIDPAPVPPVPAPTPAPTPTPTPAPEPAEPAATEGAATEGAADEGVVTGDVDHEGDDEAADDDQPKKKKKKKKSAITHKGGRYVELDATDGTKYRLRLIVQPMMRFTRISSKPDFVVDGLLRRARLGFDARLKHNVRVKWEIQIKNMHFGLSNLYGSFKPNDNMEISAGLIKAPGGLERDTYSFNGPFIERSIIADFTYDHEVGVKLEAKIPDTSLFYAASVTRTPPFGIDGGDPEDSPKYPPNVEADDITRSSSKWNTAARFGTAPSHAFEASIHAAARLRLDSGEPDFGDRFAEPYDSGFVNPRPYWGVNVTAAADAALVQPHFRVMMEGGFRRDGHQLAIDQTTGVQTDLHGHLNSEAGYLVFGWTPNGKYAKAVDNAFLKKGWEIITRFEGARVKPVDVSQIVFLGVTTGFHWEVTPSMRLQADFGYQWYSRTAEGTNSGGPNREIFQLWATWRI